MLDDGRLWHARRAGRVNEQELVFEPDGVLNLLVHVAARLGRDRLVQVFGPGNEARASGQAGAESWERRIFVLKMMDDFVNA